MSGPVRSAFAKAGRQTTSRVLAKLRPRDAFFFDEVRRDDTYLVSYPRSGNTYLRHLMASLVLDRAPTPSEVQKVVPDVHRSPNRARPERPGPLVAKSHAPARPVPARVVYLVRDGRQALVSYYRYLQERNRPTPDNAGDMLAWPAAWPCPWADHVTGWLHQLDGREDSLIIRYEDMVVDPTSVLRTVANLVGITASDQRLERAVANSSVESMQAAERAAPGSLNFVGSPGVSWREAVGAEALGRFEAMHGHLLKRLGYDTTSPDRA